ncbi:hypothetical protein SVIOM342S_03442 [Streptomyces violaceorubidus]
MHIALREVHDSDLPVFFRQMNDPEALRMAAFTPKDPADWEAFGYSLEEDPGLPRRGADHPRRR